jgi:CRP-like cAMP-binding protein
MTDDVKSKINKFFSAYKIRKLPKGQILILSGDEDQKVYQLIRGKVKMYDINYRGEEIILNIFKPPAFFPMSQAVNKSESPYIFETDSDVEVRQAPSEAAVNFLKENPDVLFDLLARVYRGVDGILGRVVQLSGNSAHSRLIYELVIEARRFGRQEADGSWLLTLHEKDLGARASLSRETVSREVKKLKEKGLIAIQSDGVVIHDLANLEHALHRPV